MINLLKRNLLFLINDIIKYFILILLLTLFLILGYSNNNEEIIYLLSGSDNRCETLITKLLVISINYMFIFLTFKLYLKDLERNYTDIFLRISKTKWLINTELTLLLINVLFGIYLFLLDIKVTNILVVLVIVLSKLFIENIGMLLININKNYALIIMSLLLIGLLFMNIPVLNNIYVYNLVQKTNVFYSFIIELFINGLIIYIVHITLKKRDEVPYVYRNKKCK